MEVAGGDSVATSETLNVPVTRVEERGDALAEDEHESTAQVIGTQLLENVGGTVTYTDGAASIDTYGNANYPLGWRNLTGQAPQMFDNDDVALHNNTSNSTLDGMIVLAGNTTTYTQDDNYKIDQVRDGVKVSFDMATGRSEEKLSGGYGYFGTTEVAGTLWYDADFDGVQEIGTDGDAALADTEVRLAQWFYLDGSLVNVTVDGKVVPRFQAAAVTNNKGQVLRAAKTYEDVDVNDIHGIELVRDDADAVVGA